MKWVQEKPIIPGWYWWRDKQPSMTFVRIYLVYDLEDGKELVAGDEELKPVGTFGGEWYGPLEIPA